MKKTTPIILLVALFAAAAIFFFMRQPEPVHEVAPVQRLPSIPAAPEPKAPAPQPEPEAGDLAVEIEPVAVLPDPLPALAASDNEVTAALSELVSSDSLGAYLVRDHLISRLVAALDSLTSRQVSPQVNPVKPVDGAFLVEVDGDRISMSAENFARYDAYVSLLQSTDTDALLALYQRYQPLFQEAWEENGGEGAFDQRLLEVIDHMLGTPDVPGPVYLYKPEAFYLFEDPELEAMTAGQKVLVRMGSANAATVKETLTKVRASLNP